MKQMYSDYVEQLIDIEIIKKIKIFLNRHVYN